MKLSYFVRQNQRIEMQLLGGCGFCEKCVILASMAGVVQNAVVHNVVQNEQGNIKLFAFYFCTLKSFTKM